MTIYQKLAREIAENHQKMGRSFIQGILGGQGTGKTTLAASVSAILEQMGYRTACLSLDDLYKTYCDRMILLQQDSRLIWRGPPGTHDVELGLAVLDEIRNSHNNNPQNPITIPRFDKSLHNGAGDRSNPEIIPHIDILLFEGWFVGVRPIDAAAFNNPPPPIITVSDKTFARDINRELTHYLPLWERIDNLIVLYPQDYRYSVQWRKQAEHQMKATGKPGMTDMQIEEFVNYFWRALHPELFIKPLISLPEYVNLVIEINADHSFGKIHREYPNA
ncbi:glycerate kinase [Brunnivagina elsteri]|uniref:Glycerate kinase n=1 Tax=Brunnivagina elsteri CCALA 953 TaxID=987040 RepID=A0A2A2TDY4_9CYAN|nr:glycerate kinase [Calothrix elsteri]PAX51933.1 glycerate kinase [Calothrix elsteri CCALA 953]